MRTARTALLAILALGVAGGLAHASTKIFGRGLAATCSTLALNGDSTRETLKTCTQALEDEALGSVNAAKTHVNRGVVYLRRASLKEAQGDFAAAEKLKPDLAEIYINRGVVFMKEQRWTDAIAEIERGMVLKPSEIEKAYFNRALAREQLDDFKGAYSDFKMAAQLAPMWEPPQKELSRYTVRRP